MRLQAVRSVASDSKFYRLPPDKENTGVSRVSLSEEVIMRCMQGCQKTLK